MTERFFTPKEANQILPEVRKIVEGILIRADSMRALIKEGNLSGEHKSQLMELDSQIKSFMGQLEEMGCHYKDWNFEIGLVDFPAIIHGQEALLCWRSDEPKVAWFHSYEDGYAGRQTVTEGLIFS